MEGFQSACCFQFMNCSNRSPGAVTQANPPRRTPVNRPTDQ